jgi:hypothetical protein
MDSIVRKCLSARERTFEQSGCPAWLSSILPSRIKSVETIIDNECESEPTPPVDLSPYKLVHRIVLLPKQNVDGSAVSVSNVDQHEYPHQSSFVDEQLNNACQLLYSPSNAQLLELLTRLRRRDVGSERAAPVLHDNQRCTITDCERRRVPLTRFCRTHLIDNDDQQIFVSKCSDCDEMFVREDKRAIFHLCSSLT